MTDISGLRPSPAPATGQGGPDGDLALQPDRRRASRHRLVVEVSNDLHRRIVTICATRRIPVNQAVREVLEKAFPEK